MASLKDQITADMKTALRAGDKARLGVLRMALSAIKQREIDERIELDDLACNTVIEKMVKQRRESIVQYEKGAREDLAAVERAEIDVLTTYLPEPLDADALAALIDEAIAETGAANVRDMGKVMALVKTRAEGRADMSAVAASVRQRLSG